MLEQRIQQQFFDSADLKYAAAEHLTRPVADASHALIGAITSGAKVLVCGNGAGAGIAQHLAAQLVGRFERERPGLAALCLAADATNYILISYSISLWKIQRIFGTVYLFQYCSV